MRTTDVRIDVKLNKQVWSKVRPRTQQPAGPDRRVACARPLPPGPQGIRAVPKRVRVVIQRRRNDDEDAKVGTARACRARGVPPACA